MTFSLPGWLVKELKKVRSITIIIYELSLPAVSNKMIAPGLQLGITCFPHSLFSKKKVNLPSTLHFKKNGSSLHPTKFSHNKLKQPKIPAMGAI